MTIEQELSDILYDNMSDSAIYEDVIKLTKVILSSGLVIPVSALDEMVEKVEAAIKKTPSLNGAFIDHKGMAENAIGVIKEEIRKE